MPNRFRNALEDIKSSVEVPTPPAFGPIAAMLLPTSYKADLSRIIKSAPKEFYNSREWWEQVRKVTRSSWSDIGKVRDNIKRSISQKRVGTADLIKRFSELPGIKKDRRLQHMIDLYVNKTEGGVAKTKKNTSDGQNRNGKARISDPASAEIVKLQRLITQRLAGLQKELKKRQETLKPERGAAPRPPGKKPAPVVTSPSSLSSSVSSDHSQPENRGVSSESKESKGEGLETISEGSLSDVVSKMTAFFASPQLSKTMMVDSLDKFDNINLAKSAVYYLLKIIADSAYDKLEGMGISRRDLITLYKNKDDATSKSKLDKIASVLNPSANGGSTPISQSEPPQQVSPKVDKRWRGDPNQFDGKRAPSRSKDSKSDTSGMSSQETQEFDTGAMIYKQMVKASKHAKMVGSDPIASADQILAKYEHQGLPEAAIIRRMFERSRNNRAS